MANRETRRKKKIKKEYEVVPTVETNAKANALIMVLVVVAVLVVFYVVTFLLTTKFDFSKDKDKAETPKSVLQYNNILASQTFNMHYDEYYVVFYDFVDPTVNLYSTMVTNFKTSNSKAKVYTVDLSKGINKQYMSNKSNLNTSNINELKISGPTVIKVENGTNSAYGEGADAMKNILK